MYCITVESNRPSPRKQRHTDPVIHSRLLTHNRSPCLRPFLHRTLNHISQAASTHTTDAGFQLWRQNSSQPELVVKPVSQPVRRNQLDPLPGYSCAVSHAAVQVTGPPVQPAGQPDTYSPIGIMLNVRSLLHGGGFLEKRSVLWISHRHWTCWALCICYSLYTSLCACVTSGVWAHSNIVMM